MAAVNVTVQIAKKSVTVQVNRGGGAAAAPIFWSNVSFQTFANSEPSPPPAEGTRLIVGSSGWNGQNANAGALRTANAWAFFPPSPGQGAISTQTGGIYLFSVAGWKLQAVSYSAAPSLSTADASTAGTRLVVDAPVVIANNTTLASRIQIVETCLIKPNGKIVTIGGSLITPIPPPRMFDMTAGGSIVFNNPQDLFPDLVASSRTDAQAIKTILTAAKAGSRIRLTGGWISGPIVTSPLDKDKSIVSDGGMDDRLTENPSGPYIQLAAGSNLPLFDFDTNWNGERCGFLIQDILLNGNRAQQSNPAGLTSHGIQTGSIKGLYLRGVYIEQFAGTGFLATTHGSSNACFYDQVNTSGCNGAGFDFRGSSDSQLGAFVSGGDKGLGVVINGGGTVNAAVVFGKSNIELGKLRVFSAGGNTGVPTYGLYGDVGAFFKGNMLHINDSQSANMRLHSCDKTQFGISYFKNAAIGILVAGNTIPTDERVHCLISGTSKNIDFLSTGFDDDNVPPTTQYNIYMRQSGVNTVFHSINKWGPTSSGRNILTAGGANIGLGNFIVLPRTTQVIPYAPTIDLGASINAGGYDLTNGTDVQFILAGNQVVTGPPAAELIDGFRFLFHIIQPAGGGCTWAGAGTLQYDGSGINLTPNAVTDIEFVARNGVLKPYNVALINGGVPFTIDDGGVPLVAGVKYGTIASYSGIMVVGAMIGDATGSAQVEVWKANAARPTSANKISGTNPLTLTNQDWSSNNLAGWSTPVSINDVIYFNLLNGASGLTHIDGMLRMIKTS